MLALVMLCFTCFKLLPVLKKKIQGLRKSKNRRSDDKSVEMEHKSLKSTVLEREKSSSSKVP